MPPIPADADAPLMDCIFDRWLENEGLAVNPYGLYRDLRRQAPVCWSQRWNAWIISRYHDVSPILQDTRRFSNAGRVVHAIRKEYPPEQQNQLRLLMSHYSQGLIHSDPPDHARLRRLVQGTFVPRILERLRPRIHEIVNELLDAAQDSDAMDVVRQLSYPLPVTVIAELLGIPAEMREQFKHWSQGIVAFMASPRLDLPTALASQASLHELREYFRKVFDERRRQPREDLITDLVHAHAEGDRLSEEELFSTCVTILIGGHETTTSLLSSAVHLLLRHPHTTSWAKSNARGWPAVVEECLRYEPPFQRILRVALEDVTLHGRTMRTGQMVVLLLGSANRDEAVFANPDAFDPTRTEQRHLSFGYGPHFCLGAALSRLETPIALAHLFERYPNLRPNYSEPIWSDGMVRTITSLPVRW